MSKEHDEKVERVAKAICRETCAFYGDPPCFEIDEGAGMPWDGHCDEPGCHALALAAVAAMEGTP